MVKADNVIVSTPKLPTNVASLILPVVAETASSKLVVKVVVDVKPVAVVELTVTVEPVVNVVPKAIELPPAWAPSNKSAVDNVATPSSLMTRSFADKLAPAAVNTYRLFSLVTYAALLLATPATALAAKAL